LLPITPKQNVIFVSEVVSNITYIGFVQQVDETTATVIKYTKQSKSDPKFPEKNIITWRLLELEPQVVNRKFIIKTAITFTKQYKLAKKSMKNISSYLLQ
jgi:hypothetical protein